MNSAFSFGPDDLPTPWRRAEIREGLQAVRKEQEQQRTRARQEPTMLHPRTSDHVMVSSDNKGGRRRKH